LLRLASGSEIEDDAPFDDEERRDSSSSHPPSVSCESSGVHWLAATRARNCSALVLDASPARWASRPTADAISTATVRRSWTAGRSEPDGFFRAGAAPSCGPLEEFQLLVDQLKAIAFQLIHQVDGLSIETLRHCLASVEMESSLR
jgi:hypothetical protein